MALTFDQESFLREVRKLRPGGDTGMVPDPTQMANPLQFPQRLAGSEDAGRDAGATPDRRAFLQEVRALRQAPQGQEAGRDASPSERARATNGELNPIEGFISGYARGSGQLAEGLGSFLEMLGGDADRFRLSTVGRELERMGKVTQDANRASQSVAEGKPFQPGNWRWWLEGTGQALPMLVSSMATGGATSGVAGYLGLGQKLKKAAELTGWVGSIFPIESGFQYKESRAAWEKQGMAPEEAHARAVPEALLYGMGASILEGIPGSRFVLGKVPGAKKVFAAALSQKAMGLLERIEGKTLGKALTGAGAESLQEMSQELWSDTMAYVHRQDPEAYKDWFSRYAAAGALAALPGAGAGMVAPGYRRSPGYRRAEGEEAPLKAPSLSPQPAATTQPGVPGMETTDDLDPGWLSGDTHRPGTEPESMSPERTTSEPPTPLVPPSTPTPTVPSTSPSLAGETRGSGSATLGEARRKQANPPETSNAISSGDTGSMSPGEFDTGRMHNDPDAIRNEIRAIDRTIREVEAGMDMALSDAAIRNRQAQLAALQEKRDERQRRLDFLTRPVEKPRTPEEQADMARRTHMETLNRLNNEISSLQAVQNPEPETRAELERLTQERDQTIESLGRTEEALRGQAGKKFGVRGSELEVSDKAETRSESMSPSGDVYDRMPLEMVRAQAEHGVKAAQEALKRREGKQTSHRGTGAPEGREATEKTAEKEPNRSSAVPGLETSQQTTLLTGRQAPTAAPRPPRIIRRDAQGDPIMPTDAEMQGNIYRTTPLERLEQLSREGNTEAQQALIYRWGPERLRQLPEDLSPAKARVIKMLQREQKAGNIKADTATVLIDWIKRTDADPLIGWKIIDEVRTITEDQALVSGQRAGAQYVGHTVQMVNRQTGRVEKAVIELLRGHNPSTPIHEIAHAMLYLAPEGVRQAAEKHFGKDYHEAVAEAFQRYYFGERAMSLPLRIRVWFKQLAAKIREFLTGASGIEAMPPRLAQFLRDVAEGKISSYQEDARTEYNLKQQQKRRIISRMNLQKTFAAKVRAAGYLRIDRNANGRWNTSEYGDIPQFDAKGNMTIKTRSMFREGEGMDPSSFTEWFRELEDYRDLFQGIDDPAEQLTMAMQYLGEIVKVGEREFNARRGSLMQKGNDALAGRKTEASNTTEWRDEAMAESAAADLVLMDEEDMRNEAADALSYVGGITRDEEEAMLEEEVRAMQAKRQAYMQWARQSEDAIRSEAQMLAGQAGYDAERTEAYIAERLAERLAIRAAMEDAGEALEAPEGEQFQYAGAQARGFEEARAEGRVFVNPYDRKPRFEFSDDLSELTDHGKAFFHPSRRTDYYSSMRMETLLEHDALYAQYPQLHSMIVDMHYVPKMKLTQSRGSFRPGKKSLLGTPLKNLNEEPSIDVTAGSPEAARAILLHEIQHAIQDIEGHAEGGALDRQAAMEEVLQGEYGQQYNETLAEIERLERIKNEFESAWQGGKAVVGRLGRGARNAALEREHPGLLEELRLQREILNTYEEKARRQAATLAQDRYRRIPGEIEAWDTMERRDLSAAERPGKTPYAGQPGAQAPLPWNEAMEGVEAEQFQTTPIRITGEDGVKEKKEDFDHRDTEGTENMPNGGSAVLGLAAMSDGALSEKMEEYRQRVAPLEARSEALAKTVARQKQKMGTTLAERKRRAVDDEMSAIYREYEPFQKEINRRSLRRRVERGEINRLNVHLLSEFQREPWAAGAWERYAGEPAERRKPLAIDLNRWQAEVDALADPYLRSNALEEIADRPIADAQFRQVLDRAPGLPNARRIFYAVFRNPKASAETRTRAWEMHENEPFGATIVSPKDAEAMEKKPPEGGTPERGLIEKVEREEERAQKATAQERATDLFPQEAPSAPVRPRNLMQQGDLFGAPEGASKPPHQMTLLEFFAHQGINYRTASQQKRTNTEKLYKAVLARAIAEGLDISPEAGAVSRDLQNFIENELRKARGEEPGQLDLFGVEEQALAYIRDWIRRYEHHTQLDMFGTGMTRAQQRGVERALLELPETRAEVVAQPAEPRRPLNSGGIRTVADQFNREMLRDGFIDLRGRKVENPEEMAVLAQVFRDPRLETLRYFYLKDGVIVAHEGISSGLPGSSYLYPRRPMREGESYAQYGQYVRSQEALFYERMRGRMARLGADGYYLVHNHPTGIPNASSADIDATEKIARRIAGFQGHIIIDHDRFGWLRQGGVAGEMMFSLERVPGAPEADPLRQYGHRLLGKELNDASMLATLSHQMTHERGRVTLLYRNVKGFLSGIQTVPEGMLRDTQSMAGWIRNQARLFGASMVFATVNGTEVQGATMAALEKVRQTGAISQVYDVWTQGVSAVDYLAAREWLGKRGEDAGAVRVGEKEQGAVNSQQPTGPFGPIFPQYQGDAQGAIRRLLRERQRAKAAVDELEAKAEQFQTVRMPGDLVRADFAITPPVLSPKSISELAQLLDHQFARGWKDAYRETRPLVEAILRKESADYLDGYHVATNADIEDIAQSGINGSEWYDKPEGVYFFADPSDIERSYLYLNMKRAGDEAEYLPVVHFRIPKSSLKNVGWDGFHNVSYGTYSSFLHVGDIPAAQILEIKRIAMPGSGQVEDADRVKMILSDEDLAPGQERFQTAEENRVNPGLPNTPSRSALDELLNRPDMEEVRKRIDAASKPYLPENTVLGRAWAKIRKLVQAFASSTPHIVTSAKALRAMPATVRALRNQLREKLRQQKEHGVYAATRAVLDMKQIYDQVRPEDMPLFRQAAMVKDLRYEVERQRAQIQSKDPEMWQSTPVLPFGLSVETLIEMEVAMQADLQANEGVRRALARRDAYWRALGEKLANAGILTAAQAKNPAYLHHIVLEYDRAGNVLFRDLESTGNRLKEPHYRGYQKTRYMNPKDYALDVLRIDTITAAQMIQDLMDQELITWLKNSGLNRREEFEEKARKATEEARIANPKAREVHWRQMVDETEGVAVWAVHPGVRWFARKGVAGAVMQDLVRRLHLAGPNAEIQARLSQGDIVDLTEAVGFEELVLPADIVAHLNDLRNQDFIGSADVIFGLTEPIMTFWKRMMLFSPNRVVRYNINNTIGDLEGVLMAEPAILKGGAQWRKTMRDLWEFYANDNPSPEMLEAIRTGALSGGITTAELSHRLHEMPGFERFCRQMDGKLSPKDEAKAVAKMLYQIPLKAGMRASQFRESILRYKAFLYYMEAEARGDRTHYGASRKIDLEGLEGTDRAARLAREVLIDYGDISAAGQVLREGLLPFYSWTEGNIKRFKRLVENVWLNDEVGWERKLAAALPPAGRMAAAMLLFSGGLALLNRLRTDDEDREGMSDYAKRRGYIALGSDKDNAVYYIRAATALRDIGEWVGFVGPSEWPQVWAEIKAGQITLADALTHVPKAAINKLAGGMGPVKSAVELASGQRFFPDVFDAMPIGKRDEAAMEVWGLGREYQWLKGFFTPIPGRGAGDYLLSLLAVKRNDPGLAAYGQVMGLKFDFEEKVLNQTITVDYKTPKAQVARQYRLAVRWGDEQAKEALERKMKAMGMSKLQIRARLKSADPLYGLNARQKRAFRAWLTPEQQRMLEAAEAFYQRMFR